ncbi:hypothetical protein GCM10010521_30440 [Streptomyces rameus]|uniref:Integrase n=1 Tax=Streptomyces rameus TaxID=68261 RepID=A0ABP6NAC0_9ACTN
MTTSRQYLGHSDPGLTLRVYAHLMPSSQERTRKAVAAVFDTARSGPLQHLTAQRRPRDSNKPPTRGETEGRGLDQ